MSDLLPAARAWVVELRHPHERHLLRTEDWAVELEPDASEQLRLAAVLHDVERAFSLQSDKLTLVGVVFAVYAAVEGLEAVGLWFQRRWAEYLTFIVTASLLPLEVYELSHRLTIFKVLAFVINVAVVAYLLYAKRLFGLRGGADAERREREEDMGWPALERSSPEAVDADQSRRRSGSRASTGRSS
jgi:uncharacterized membrane protein (DUF2068 family)